MDVTVKASVLAEELALAARVSAKKETIPALQYVLVEASGLEGLTLTASDLDVSSRAECAAVIAEPGAVLLHARRFAELSRLFRPDGDVRIQVSKKNEVTVTSGAYGGRMQSMPPSEFPAIPALPTGERLLLPAKVMPDLLRQVEYAIAEHDARYFTAGAFVRLKDGRATVVGTDGYRVVVSSAPVDTPTETNALVPRKAVPELSALFSGAEEATLAVTENHLFFSSGPRTIITRVISGQFPTFDRIIPKANPSRMSVDRDALQSAVRRVTLVADGVTTRSVTLTAAPGKITVRAAGADVGEAEEPVEAAYDGAALAVTVNGAYLSQFLAQADGQRVRVEMATETKPILLTQEDESRTSNLCVLAPVRV